MYFMRPFLVRESSPVANARSLVRQIRLRIFDRVASAGPPFHGVYANNFNRLLKGTMTALRLDQGGCYAPHTFRRGAADEIKYGD